MKTILYVLVIGLALPFFLICGFLVANALTEPAFEPVDLENPPLELAVLGAWEDTDGRLVCRAFYYRDLTAHSDSLPALRFTVSNEEFGLCVTAFRGFGVEGRWANEFDWDRPGFLASVERPDSDDPDLFVVTYRSDDDRGADSRYRVDQVSGEPKAFEFQGYFGPARGLGIVVLGGAIGTVAWVLLLTFALVRKVRRGRANRNATSTEAGQSATSPRFSSKSP